LYIGKKIYFLSVFVGSLMPAQEIAEPGEPSRGSRALNGEQHSSPVDTRRMRIDKDVHKVRGMKPRRAL
jgi:hypothetical protein